MTGAAAVYSEQHTMHHRWAVSRREEKHEVCRLITLSILIIGHSSFCKEVALGLLSAVVPKSLLSDIIFILKFREKGSLPS